MRLGGSHVTSVFGAVKQNLLRKMRTEQTRQVFPASKSIQVLGNADSHVLEMFHQVFERLAAFLSFVLEQASLSLVVSSGGWKRRAVSISEALETPSSTTVLLSFPTVHFVSQLRTKNELTLPVHYKDENIIDLLVQCIMNTWIVIKENKDLESWESVVQPYLYYDWNMEICLVLGCQADKYFFLGQQTGLNGLQRRDFLKTSQPLDVRIKPDVRHSSLLSWTNFVIETLHNVSVTSIYSILGANVLYMNALKISKWLQWDCQCSSLNSVYLLELFCNYSFQPSRRDWQRFWTPKSMWRERKRRRKINL